MSDTLGVNAFHDRSCSPNPSSGPSMEFAGLPLAVQSSAWTRLFAASARSFTEGPFFSPAFSSTLDSLKRSKFAQFSVELPSGSKAAVTARLPTVGSFSSPFLLASPFSAILPFSHASTLASVLFSSASAPSSAPLARAAEPSPSPSSSRPQCNPPHAPTPHPTPPPTPTAPLSQAYIIGGRLLCGALGGILSRTATAPLDRVKVLMQAQGGHPLATAKAVARDGLPAFFRGNAANCLKVAPEHATKFVVFDALKALAESRAKAAAPGILAMEEAAHAAAAGDGGRAGATTAVMPTAKRSRAANGEVSPIVRLMAGGAAGMASQGLVYPLEVVKTRMAVAATGVYKSVFGCLKHTYALGGLKGLYAGLIVSMVGIVPYAGIDLAVMTWLRDVAQKYLAAQAAAVGAPAPTPTTSTLIWCGVISSTCAMLVTYPLNLIRTRMQAVGIPVSAVTIDKNGKELRGGGDGRTRHAGWRAVYREVVARQGLRGLYAGVSANMCKVLPATGISFAVYEKGCHLLKVK